MEKCSNFAENFAGEMQIWSHLSKVPLIRGTTYREYTVHLFQNSTKGSGTITNPSIVFLK